MQGSFLVPDVLRQIFGLSNGGEVGDTDSLGDRAYHSLKWYAFLKHVQKDVFVVASLFTC